MQFVLVFFCAAIQAFAAEKELVSELSRSSRTYASELKHTTILRRKMLRHGTPYEKKGEDTLPEQLSDLLKEKNRELSSDVPVTSSFSAPDVCVPCESLAEVPRHQPPEESQSQPLTLLEKTVAISEKLYAQSATASELSGLSSDESALEGLRSTSYVRQQSTINIVARQKRPQGEAFLNMIIHEAIPFGQKALLATFRYFDEYSTPDNPFELAKIWSCAIAPQNTQRSMILEHNNACTHLFTYTQRDSMPLDKAFCVETDLFSARVVCHFSETTPIIIAAEDSCFLLPFVEYQGKRPIFSEKISISDLCLFAGVLPYSDNWQRFAGMLSYGDAWFSGEKKPVKMTSFAEIFANTDTFEAELYNATKEANQSFSVQMDICASRKVVLRVEDTMDLAKFTYTVRTACKTEKRQVFHLCCFTTGDRRKMIHHIMLRESHERIGCFTTCGSAYGGLQASMTLQSCGPHVDEICYRLQVMPSLKQQQQHDIDIIVLKDGLMFKQGCATKKHIFYNCATDSFCSSAAEV